MFSRCESCFNPYPQACPGGQTVTPQIGQYFPMLVVRYLIEHFRHRSITGWSAVNEIRLNGPDYRSVGFAKLVFAFLGLALNPELSF